MYLLIDSGNTLTKVTSVAKTGLFDFEESFKTGDWLSFSDFYKNSDAEYVILSTVVDWPDEILDQLRKKAKSFHILDVNSQLPFRVSYDSPETLGADRLACVAGAIEKFPESDCLIVNFGSCITYNLLDRNSEFKGGSISPGLEMRFKAMNVFTGRLPALSYKEYKELPFAQDTNSAIASGVIDGIIFEVKGFINKYSHDFNDLKIIITGGDHKVFANRLQKQIFADENLQMTGLLKILELNKKDD
jgi:type III pantothenate kinase